jgi:hypothetical protein
LAARTENSWAASRRAWFHQLEHIAGLEPPAEVARGGGIGDPLGAKGIEEDLVVAPQFEMLDAGTASQDVAGDGQDVIALVIRQLTLEHVAMLVDVADQPGALGQQVDGPDVARGHGTGSVGQFVVDVGGSEHRLVAFAAGGLLKATLNPACVERAGGRHWDSLENLRSAKS